MRLTLVIPTLNRYDLLARLLASIYASSSQPDDIHVIDNGGSCPQFHGIRITTPGCNLGVAASWNLGLRDAAPGLTLIANDDIEVDQFAIERMREHIKTYSLVTCRSRPPGGNEGRGWSFFMQREEVAARIGYYDEGFWPAYYEDCDYFYRLTLAKVPMLFAPDVLTRERFGIGSTTCALDDFQRHRHKRLYDKNRDRFLAKWGGLPGRERFVQPFNGQPYR
jgi:GT2 family glycosyltransferase